MIDHPLILPKNVHRAKSPYMLIRTEWIEWEGNISIFITTDCINTYVDLD